MRREVNHDEEEIQALQFRVQAPCFALKRASEDGVTDKEVCEDLGVSERQLRRWRDQFRLDGEEAFPGLNQSHSEEVAELKRKLQRAEQERDFLKDAAVFFAKESK
jgi:transposase